MLLIAHRMPATAARCERLHRAGANVFEVDVQLAASGGSQLVMSHYVPVRGFGEHLRRDEWRLRWHGRDPMLQAQLDLVPDGSRVLLDLKERTPQRRQLLVDAIIAGLPDVDRFAASTPRTEDLVPLRAAGFETWRSITNAVELDRALSADIAEAAVTVRHTLLDATTVDRLHARVGTVIAWTVNRVARADQLRAAGVDGITTDSVAVLARMAS